MSYPIPDHTPQPLGPGVRALIGEAAAREADAEWLRARLSLHAVRITRFLMWMDGAGIPRDQFTAEWFEAIAPTLPQCQIAPKKDKSSGEQTLTELLADALYLKRKGLASVELSNHLRGVHPYSIRWGKWGTSDTVKTRLSEARNNTSMGKMLARASDLFGAPGRIAVEDAIVERFCASKLQSAVTDFS